MYSFEGIVTMENNQSSPPKELLASDAVQPAVSTVKVGATPK